MALRNRIARIEFKLLLQHNLISYEKRHIFGSSIDEYKDKLYISSHYRESLYRCMVCGAIANKNDMLQHFKFGHTYKYLSIREEVLELEKV